VPILDAYGTGTGASVAIASVDTAGGITSFTITGGTNYSAPIVDFTAATTEGGSGAASTAYVTPDPGTGLPKFVDKLPQLGPAGANNVTQAHGDNQYIPVGIAEPCSYSGQAADCYSIAVVEYSEKLSSNLPPTRQRAYVQLETPGLLTYMGAQNPPLVSKHVSVGGGKFAIDNPHYLGPVLVAQGRVAGIANTLPSDPGYPRPIRITFYNLLPSGAGGDLFIPVDETVPGSGAGPALPATGPENFTQNRATVHLHGNNTVWISDGNTHQWITPATENTAYPAGASARNVPDMGTGCDAVAGSGLPGDPGTRKSSGCMTLFYTNAQSARLRFYHDHSMGITRLNVYAGEAAGYLLTDAVEKDLINGTNISGVNIAKVLSPDPIKPGDYLSVLPGLGIPLIIQDKTFVDSNTVFAQDPTWNWGTGPRYVATDPEVNADPTLLGKIKNAVTGDLWYPHVYMVASNPYDPTGMNAFGRWFYGPWFNPPTPVCGVDGKPVGCIEVGLVPNEYADPATPGYSPLEPPMLPGVPNPSIPGESFLDTPLVNGTAYPYIEVPAGPVRFRV